MDRPAAIAKLAEMLIENESRATKVARLLHDEAGQTLTAIGFHLQALGGDPETNAEIRSLLDQTVENLREACNALHSNVVERSGLPIAMELLGERLRRQAGLSLAFELNLKRRLPPALGFAIYRVVELALDNVVRHSGANHATVAVESNESGLTAIVSDCGTGFPKESISTHPPGTGLILMESYANQFQLHLQIDSALGKGTIVKIQTF